MKEVNKADILNEIQAMKDAQARFVTMTCCDTGDAFELIYSFDKELELINVRTSFGKDEAAPSASGIYSCAFLIENEIKDQFGLDFDNLAPDFKGLLLLSQDAPPTPMRRNNNQEEGGKVDG